MVCGALSWGTLAGGQSTIGTAQLAFSYGLSAAGGSPSVPVWEHWFWACSSRDRYDAAACTTLLEVVSREYGHKAETIGSVLFLVGIFTALMSQVISSSAMIGSLFGMPTQWASMAVAALIMLMVLHGGIRSAVSGASSSSSCSTCARWRQVLSYGTWPTG